MSRSIHETAAEFRRLVESGEPREVLRAEATRLRDKHRIKRAVRRQRRTEDAPLPLPTIDALPVRVMDEGPHVHHGASAEDVREVLRRLPPGTIDGLAAVKLTLGWNEQVRRARLFPAGERPDPYTGRLGIELGEGVWCGRVLGRYRPPASTIEVYAFVVADRDAPDWPFWAWELRFRALATLVHEAAHHHDTACRVARGRWRAAAGARAEAYAVTQAREWRRSIVGPYMEERYPDEMERFQEYEARQNAAASHQELAGWMNGLHPRHVRRSALRLLAARGKWDGLTWILLTCASEDAADRHLGMRHLRQWMARFNRTFTQTTRREQHFIHLALVQNAPVLDAKTVATLRFYAGLPADGTPPPE